MSGDLCPLVLTLNWARQGSPEPNLNPKVCNYANAKPHVGNAYENLTDVIQELICCTHTHTHTHHINNNDQRLIRAWSFPNQR